MSNFCPIPHKVCIGVHALQRGTRLYFLERLGDFLVMLCCRQFLIFVHALVATPLQPCFVDNKVASVLITLHAILVHHFLTFLFTVALGLKLFNQVDQLLVSDTFTQLVRWILLSPCSP